MELLAQYRTGIELMNLDTFTFVPNTSGFPNNYWSTIKDDNGKFHLKHISSGKRSNHRFDGYLKLENILKLDTTYKLSFNVNIINDFGPRLLVGGNRINLVPGKNSIIRNSNESTNIIFTCVTTAEFTITNIEIEEVTYERLDLDINERILLSNSLKDIKTPDEMSGEFSKTFSLPSTTINDRFFGYIKNNDADSYFNIKKKVKASIEDNGLQITNGNIQLINIEDEDGKINYEVRFTGPSTSFFSDLKTKKLYEIDSNEIVDHKYDIVTAPADGDQGNNDLVTSWEYHNGTEAKAANQPYVYSCIDKGINFTESYFGDLHNFDKSGIPNSPNSYRGLNMDDFTLHMYVWYLWEKIHTEFGYTYSGDIFNSTDFNDLAVPVSRNLTRVVDEEPQISIDGVINNLYPGHGEYQSSAPLRKNQTVSTIISAVPSTNHSENVYNKQYITPNNTVKRKHILKLRLESAGVSGAGTIKATIYMYMRRTISSPYDLLESYELTHTQFNVAASDEGPVYVYEPVLEIPEVMLRGEEIFNFIHDKGVYFRIRFQTLSDNPVWIRKVYWDLKSVEEDVDDTKLMQGDTFSNPCQFLDSKTSYLDFIKSILTTFNLYVDVDEENKHIYYRTFNEYYDHDIKDFTKNVAYNEAIEKTFLSELNKKTFLISHTKGTDLHSKDYFESKEKIYGSDIIDSGNEFNIGEDKITTKIIPSISRTIDFPNDYYANIIDASTKFGVINNKIGFRLVYPRMQTLSDTDTIFLGSLNLKQWSWTKCFISNEFKYKESANNFSLSFDKPEIDYINKGTGGINYVIDKYWQDYLDLILDKDNYLLTLSLKLSVIEYTNLSLRDTIIIENQKFIINNIKDFNPNNLTIIELIRIT